MLDQLNKTTGQLKKAIVVGGSNGIGLAISKKLIDKGYLVIIFDRVIPQKDLLPENNYSFRNCNIIDFSKDIFMDLIDDLSVEVLMYTAGFGRCTHFENLNLGEITNMMSVNTIGYIKLVNLFYNRINSDKPFFCGVMGSIAGLINSPLFSVYAASKAAICRFVESINIELEKAGTNNRILNISPGSIRGTKFSGGDNDLSQTSDLAEEIIIRLFASKTLFIPDYEKTFKRVLSENYQDSRLFGLNSYDYKINGKRVNDEYKGCIGYLSGTFDLFHIGHLNLLKRAKSMCDYLVVGVHKDASHKGKTCFISFEERKQIVSSIKYVDEVIQSFPEDSDAWNIVHYNKLFVGSDYKGTERFNKYEEYFSDKGVEIIYFPYTNGTSSTQLREALQK